MSFVQPGDPTNAAHKRLNLDVRTHRDWKKWWKNIHANANQKKSGIALLISDKTDFDTKTIIKDKEGLLHNDKRVNLTKGFNA